jgi:hypothetical protein
LRLSWPWSYGSSIYNYLCNQCLSPLVLWVRISIRTRCTTLCDKVCQWLVTGRAVFSVSTTNKTDRRDITEILLKMAWNTIKQTNKQTHINHNSVNILTLIYSPPWLSRGEFPNECKLHWVAEKNREVKKLKNYCKRERLH